MPEVKYQYEAGVTYNAAVQCTDATTGKVGDFLFLEKNKDGFVAISPVFDDYLDFYAYCESVGLEEVPNTMAMKFSMREEAFIMRCPNCSTIMEHCYNSIGGFEHTCPQCRHKTTGLVHDGSCPECTHWLHYVEEGR